MKVFCIKNPWGGFPRGDNMTKEKKQSMLLAQYLNYLFCCLL